MHCCIGALKNPSPTEVSEGRAVQSVTIASAMPIGTKAISHGLLQYSISQWRYPGSTA